MLKASKNCLGVMRQKVGKPIETVKIPKIEDMAINKK